ncbi:LysM peptidoglycan-binding domain-containing protein [[Clostridium] fimetarium]|uniref:LysM domain-containing protein n=1 Tax=[Clostridium] fimetarium TaxID=99656 RepID=A0A1I0RCJ6_9FIRM|nr:LysM peptidoglycan-binding domain-containing protein [[Clostridium] fimetarium]SEW38582.1 LysM domain-containing protein [[Clostridium] fimetarium]
MIEIVCNDGEKKSLNEQQNIKRPKNIKQIGDMHSNKKIYIEDYVFTYINSIAYEDSDKLRVGVLLGESKKSGGESYVFIKGAVKIEIDEDENRITFSENVWSLIYEDMEKYFHNLEITGWFVTTPDVTLDFMSNLEKIHLDNFAGNMKALYLVNTSEKEEDFYFYEGKCLKKQSGYVCFYERNNDMQEYMLAKRTGKSVDPMVEDDVIHNFRTIIAEKKEVAEQKKTMSLMYGISTFMIVVVLVIGINMMNSYEKMRGLDVTLNQIVQQVANMNVKSTTSIDDETTSTTVKKIVGGVYPTEAQTQVSATVAATQAQTQAPTSSTPVDVKPVASYIVQKGDTLMSICRKIYGDSLRYKEIMEINKIDDPDKIFIGQEIKLP